MNFKLKKKLLNIFSMILAITVCTTSVCAITVGEDVSFTADEYKDQSVGEKNETTRTEEQQQWDNANLNSVNRIDTIAKSWITTLDKQTVREVYKAPDGYIFIQTGDTSIDIIKEIVDLQDDFVNGGKNYDIEHNTNFDDNVLNDEQYGVLDGIAGQMGYDDVEDLTPSDSIDWGGPDILPPEDYDDFIFHIITSGGKVIRQEIAGDMFIIDYETYVKRLQGIETLLTYYSEQETIKTQYIVEIKAESVIEETVWTSKAKTWYDTGSTHYWEFDCLESSDGEYYSSMQKFSGPNITQSFNYPGKYKVTATQLLEQTFCDAMTYSINEYWVIAETGQIIWSHESTGSRIPNTSKDGLYSLGLNNIVNYHDRGKGTYYITVYNEEIEIIDNSYDDILGTPGVWGYNFSTQRIG